LRERLQAARQREGRHRLLPGARARDLAPREEVRRADAADDQRRGEPGQAAPGRSRPPGHGDLGRADPDLATRLRQDRCRGPGSRDVANRQRARAAPSDRTARSGLRPATEGPRGGLRARLGPARVGPVGQRRGGRRPSRRRPGPADPRRRRPRPDPPICRMGRAARQGMAVLERPGERRRGRQGGPRTRRQL
ncbi:uncharacterized protein METZ01_LOCUS447955, partial [marine metagenome]